MVAMTPNVDKADGFEEGGPPTFGMRTKLFSALNLFLISIS